MRPISPLSHRKLNPRETDNSGHILSDGIRMMTASRLSLNSERVEKRQLWVRPIEWLKLNFTSCVVQQTRSLTYLFYTSKYFIYTFLTYEYFRSGNQQVYQQIRNQAPPASLQVHRTRDYHIIQYLLRCPDVVI